MELFCGAGLDAGAVDCEIRVTSDHHQLTGANLTCKIHNSSSIETPPQDNPYSKGVQPRKVIIPKEKEPANEMICNFLV